MSDISAMREHLFAVLSGVKNGSIDIAKAKAMNETAQVLINSAKVEIDFLKVTNGKSGSGFIPVQTIAPKEPYATLPAALTAHGTKQVETVPGGTVTTHKIR